MKQEKDKYTEEEIRSLMEDLEEIGIHPNLRIIVQFSIIPWRGYEITNTRMMVNSMAEKSVVVTHHEIHKFDDRGRQWYQFKIEGSESEVNKIHQRISGVSWIDKNSEKIITREYY